jgi:hypothetical protein
MEGYSLDDCIEEQRRINDWHHQHRKRQHDEKEWGGEWNDAEGRSKANAARTGTEPGVPGDAVDNDTGAGGANNPNDEACNEAISERWHGMRGK